MTELSDEEVSYGNTNEDWVEDEDQSTRPRKRRRVTSSSDESSSGSDDVELPPYPNSSGAGTGTATDESGVEAPKRPRRVQEWQERMHIPKHDERYENTFVTQLTQPHSSPSRIRGPRWKKQSPKVSIDRPGTEDNSPIRESNEGRSVPSAYRQATDTSQIVKGASVHRETTPPNDDQIPPELLDAFDSSPEPFSNHRPQSAARTAPKSLRQTTLFGAPTDDVSQTPSSQKRSQSHKWPLVNNNEQPTHHKLHQDALSTWIYPTNVGSIRDYQFNIVQRGLYHNLLVALPTGLGKTFIAAAIMLNWFRWTVEAQLVFVAPTKPLVAQQIDACFNIVGIPRSQTSMLTGNVQPALRAEEWQTRRVFFMTPQTLVRDLKSGICDPKKIILLVVDEAHRATGAYAYVEIVKFLRRFNSSFRVLALTATPGSTVETVQNVIDGLDISRVEIRNEKSMDIRQYVHMRNIELELFDDSEEMSMALELFGNAVQPVLRILNSQNAYWGKDPTLLTAFGLVKARQQYMQSDAGRKAPNGVKWMVNTIFNTLASLAHAIDLLKFHGVGPFYRYLKNFTTEKTGKYDKQILDHDDFKTLMKRLRVWMDANDFVGHPKLSYLKTVVLNHFLDAGEGQGAANGRPPSNTRIMIFVHYRDSAEEVVRVLKQHEPMVRPHIFVGQATAKGSEGMDQKTQLDIVDKFKKGTYNTIIATSIGEEGLDIGEIDLIVCYDSSSSPIRMLQRMGRTGRKRAGNIVLLLMRSKEEESYNKAKDNYEKMQQKIASGSEFHFHDDRSQRIVPKGIQPVVDKRDIEIPVENTQSDLPEPKKRGRPLKKPTKKFHMPDGVETGFVQASVITGMNKGRGVGKTTPIKVPESETAMLPSLDKVLLSTSEQSKLEQRYCTISGSDVEFISTPRLDSFPALQRQLRPVKTVTHSCATHRLVTALKADHSFMMKQRSQLAADLDGRSKKNRSSQEKPSAGRGASPKNVQNMEDELPDLEHIFHKQ
ncbi:MAG: hypothetical protein Q9227_002392 [Pyrenula ochraceoflavens]